MENENENESKEVFEECSKWFYFILTITSKKVNINLNNIFFSIQSH